MGALLTWILQALAGRLLGPDDYARFMVTWGFVFIEIGILQGLFQEVTRSVSSRSTASSALHGRGRPLVVGAAVGIAGAATLLATSWIWAPRLFGTNWLLISAAAATAFAGYAVNAAINGMLAGTRGWNNVSLSIAAESILRLLAVLGMILVGVGIAGQSWGLATAGFSWIFLLTKRSVREASRQLADRSSWRLAAGAAHALAANAFSALLISGFPVLLKITSPLPLTPQAGVLIAAVIATRAPLLLPLNAFQAVLLSRFVAFPARIWRELAVVVTITVAITAVGSIAGALVGPLLMEQIYGEEFHLGGITIGLLVASAGLVAIQTLSGSALMACSRQRTFALGWLITTTVSIGILSLDLSLDDRVVVALLAGPASGIVVNYVGLLRTLPARPVLRSRNSGRAG